jgi:hypothetical protein
MPILKVSKIDHVKENADAMGRRSSKRGSARNKQAIWIKGEAYLICKTAADLLGISSVTFLSLHEIISASPQSLETLLMVFPLKISVVLLPPWLITMMISDSTP